MATDEWKLARLESKVMDLGIDKLRAVANGKLGPFRSEVRESQAGRLVEAARLELHRREGASAVPTCSCAPATNDHNVRVENELRCPRRTCRFETEQASELQNHLANQHGWLAQGLDLGN